MLLTLLLRYLQQAMPLVVLVGLSACTQQHDQPGQQLNGTIMGTTYAISLLGEDGINAEEISAKLIALDASMTSYRDDSELMQLNQAALNTWIEVSTPLFEVLLLAQEISRLSEGAFDITVAPLVNLWGFGPTVRSFDSPPDSDSISAMMQNVGFENLQLHPSQPAVLKQRDITLDLSGIAKGYAVDQIAEMLNAHGINNYLVEIGGEIRSRGLNADAAPWRIAIEIPDSSLVHRSAQRIIQLSDQGLATSGDYRNFFELDGERYSHTINPQSGRPVQHQLASVTVISPSAAQADALATAFSVLGESAGMRLAEEQQIAAYFLVREGESFSESYSSAFASFLSGTENP